MSPGPTLSGIVSVWRLYPGSHGVMSWISTPAAGDRLNAPWGGICRMRVGLKSEMTWSPDGERDSKDVRRVREVRRVEELNFVEVVETELLRDMMMMNVLIFRSGSSLGGPFV